MASKSGWSGKLRECRTDMCFNILRHGLYQCIISLFSLECERDRKEAVKKRSRVRSFETSRALRVRGQNRSPRPLPFSGLRWSTKKETKRATIH